MAKMFNWIKNHFYYLKWYILGVIIVIGLGIFLIFDLTSREKFDYYVYLANSTGATSEMQSAVRATFEQYADDLDGDGEVKVQVIDLSYDFSSTDSQLAIAKASQLGGEMNSGGHFIFLYDNAYYEQTLNRLFEKQDFLKDKDGMAMSIKGTQFEEYFKAALNSVGYSTENLPEYFLSLRKQPDKDSKNYKVYQPERALLEKIVKSGS